MNTRPKTERVVFELSFYLYFSTKRHLSFLLLLLSTNNHFLMRVIISHETRVVGIIFSVFLPYFSKERSG